MTLPNPSSGHPSAWKKRSGFDIKLQVSSVADESVAPRQKVAAEHWTAEIGQAPAMIKTLKIA